MIKIYPCLVLKGTKAYDWWRQGKYSPYTAEEAVELIARVKEAMPPWVRVMRVQRDIPATLIDAGVQKSNLRQLVEQRLGKRRCRCVRCREVGHRMIKERIKPDKKNIQLQALDYKASEGTEIFISVEDPVNDTLIGYLRLRIPSEKAHRPEIKDQNASIIRELHICGPVVPVGTRLAEAWQHKGYGGILMGEAERISREEYGRNKILVTSALGTKEYYMRLGYGRDGPYMSMRI
jgi:elongator complex protein 3